MAFVFTVEDGTGLAAANAYITEANADDYHAGRGHVDWTGSQALKEAAIVRATDYIDKRFGKKFRGFSSFSDQGLEWPRLDAFDNDDFLYPDIPTQLQKACAEYALISLRQGELAPQPNLPVPDQPVDGSASTSTGIITGEISEKTEKVGPLEETTKYRSAGINIAGRNDRGTQSHLLNDVHIPEYPVADMWIEELLISHGSRNLSRA